MATIDLVYAREILDSRGNPTVEVEIVLTDGEKIIATAAPAGPAFEAASIKCGMRAADGAIEVVKIEKSEVVLQVIGNTEPVGLCGSGLVDAVSELAKIGISQKLCSAVFA